MGYSVIADEIGDFDQNRGSKIMFYKTVKEAVFRLLTYADFPSTYCCHRSLDFPRAGFGQGIHFQCLVFGIFE